MNMSQVTIDILNNPRFEGAISSIEWLTDYIDVGFGMAITLVAFLIILVAMFKNVLAAAYCAYPKFWNKVNDAHTKNKDAGIIKQIQEAANGMKGGTQSVTVGEIIMGVLPDIKAMTDFEADTLSPKTYFMKAIPQMIVCVIIGAFIYNGYYRDVTSKVVDVGSTLLQRTLLECDPVAMYDQFTGSAGRPVFRSDNSVDDEGKLQNRIATSLYTSIIGTYKDITSADAKRQLADKCDDMAATVVAEVKAKSVEYIDESKYKPSLTSVWSSADVPNIGDKCGTITNKDGSKSYQHAACIAIMQHGIPTSQSHPDYEHIVIRIVFEPQNTKGRTESYNDLVMIVRGGGTGNTLDFTNLNGIAEFGTPKSGMTFGGVGIASGGLSGSDTTGYEITLSGSLPVGQESALSTPITVTIINAEGQKVTHQITAIKPVTNASGRTFVRASGEKMLVDGVEATEYTLSSTAGGLGVTTATTP